MRLRARSFLADDCDLLIAEQRVRAIAEILARGVSRHLALCSPSPPFVAGRMSEKPTDSSASALALGGVLASGGQSRLPLCPS